MGDPREDLRSFPGMVRWFKPSLLLDTARQAVASALFGQYADRRLIQAALGGPLDDKGLQACDISKEVQDADGSVWVDFVADLGDGFDSTYAIAYLLAQREIAGGRPAARPGPGDGRRPGLSDRHARGIQAPVSRPLCHGLPQFAKGPGAEHPWLFLIPGNHDWYDGLVLFLALFCRGRATAVGNWRATQNRSYFARRLTDRWWVWGIDIQLSEDIDAPQADYFAKVAQSMRPDDNVIICTGVPCWLHIDEVGQGTARQEEPGLHRRHHSVPGQGRARPRGAVGRHPSLQPLCQRRECRAVHHGGRRRRIPAPDPHPEGRLHGDLAGRRAHNSR